MIDFHTHLIPGVDDGSRSTEDSLRLLRELKSAGFDRVVLSPHFYPDRESLGDFVQRRRGAYEELLKANDTGVELHLGCEVFLHEFLLHYDDLSPLCIDGSKYVMIELAYNRDAGELMLGYVERLQRLFDVVPIIAHVERCPYILKNEKFLYNFLDQGCLVQTNLEAFNGFFDRLRLFDYMKKGLVNALGTDTHRSFDRKAADDAFSHLASKFGPDWYSMFDLPPVPGLTV